MKRSILVIILTAIIPLVGNYAYSQELDLIVFTKGDSIACRIDSITGTHIYYEMKFQGVWIQTHSSRSDVLEYKQDAVNRKEFVFKPGSTIIESTRSALSESLYTVRRNAVYLGMGTLMYSRLIPGDRVGMTLGGGVFNFDGWGVIGESTVLKGGIKHFFESGIMLFCFLDLSSSEPEEEVDRFGATFRIGYRYQGPRGLLIRAAPNVIYYEGDFLLFPALSLGYAF
ncbi:MAG: hypothetical protein KAS82_00090 [Bacteroidales bacterium]|nr:hypothetical protein [Bacteroidales bacterium]